MAVFTIHRAKTELSKLIARVEAGEEIELARNKHIVAKIVPIKKPTRNLGFGVLKHLPQIPDSALFDPLPEDELDAWEGKHGLDP